MVTRLDARLKKLEFRIATNDVGFPTVCFGEANRSDDEVIGVTAIDQSVARLEKETVSALIARGGRELRQRIIFLEYAAGDHGDTCIVWPKII